MPSLYEEIVQSGRWQHTEAYGNPGYVRVITDLVFDADDPKYHAFKMTLFLFKEFTIVITEMDPDEDPNTPPAYGKPRLASIKLSTEIFRDYPIFYLDMAYNIAQQWVEFKG